MLLAWTPESRLRRLARRAYPTCAVLACLLAAAQSHAVVRPRLFTPLHGAFAQIARERGVPLESVLAEPDRWLRAESATRGRAPLPVVRAEAAITPRPPIEFTYPRLVAEGYASPVAGDFDGDGMADLLVRNPERPELQLLTGGFQHPLESGSTVVLEVGDEPIASADLDRDGRSDLIALGHTGQHIVVYRSLGDAGFAPAVAYEVGQSPGDAWIGDFNGDGWPDLAVPTTLTSPVVTNAVVTLINAHDGHFVPGSSVDIEDGPGGTAVADFDADGFDDIAVSLFASHEEGGSYPTITLLRGRPTGALELWTRIEVPAEVNVFAGELTGDSHADLVTFNNYERVIWSGAGDGTFAPLAPTPAPDAYGWRVRLGDLDGDSLLDLVAAIRRPGCDLGCPTLVVWRNLGGGSFDAVARYAAADAQTTWDSPEVLVLADFNGDGALDAAQAGWSPERTTLVLNDRAGGFLAPVSVDAPPSPWRVGTARVSPGGALEVLVWDGVETWRGADVGATGPAGYLPLGPGDFVRTLDVTGDGRDDVVLGSGDSSLVYLHDGTAGFTGPFVYPGGIALDCADFDGMLGPDLLVADEAGHVAIRHNDGSGAFGEALDAGVVLPDGVTSVAGLDLDRDGRADLVIGRNTWEPDTVEIRWNLGGGFGPAQSHELPSDDLALVGAIPSFLTTGDFDGNGLSDLLIVRSHIAWFGEIRVMLNAGARTFLSSVPYGFGRGPWEAVAADFDQDGLDDVAVVYDFDVGTGKVRIFHAGFGGVLTEMPAPFPGGFSVEHYSTSIALGDWDADDRNDFVVANQFDGTLSFFRNLSIPQTPVATSLSLVSAEAGADGVRLEWHASQPGLGAVLERALDPGAWQALAAVHADGSGRLAWTDATAIAGRRVGYRLSWAEGGAQLRTSETWLDIPLARPSVLAMEGARPNPARGAPELAFTLPNAGAARLEVFDVTGRRVASQDLLAPQPGRHVLRLATNEGLSPGLYLARLTQAGLTANARFAVVE